MTDTWRVEQRPKYYDYDNNQDEDTSSSTSVYNNNFSSQKIRQEFVSSLLFVYVKHSHGIFQWW